MFNSKRARMETFSDGVMAIAITLLALEIKVPHLQSTNLADSFRELIPLLPNIFTFILSFITIAIFWVNHHQLTQHLEHVGRRIVWVNMAFLLFQSLIPFATGAVSENPHNPLAVLTYSLILFGGSVSFTSLRLCIHPKGKLGGWRLYRGLVGPTVYFLAALIALVSVQSSYALLAIPPLFYFLPREPQKLESFE